MSPAQSVTVNIVLPQPGVGVVNTRGPIEPETVVKIVRDERAGERNVLLVIDAVGAVYPAVGVQQCRRIPTQAAILLSTLSPSLLLSTDLSDMQWMGFPMRLEVT